MNRYKNVFLKDENGNDLKINLDLDVFTIARTLFNLAEDHARKHLYLSQNYTDDTACVYYKVPLTQAEIERSAALEKELSTVSDQTPNWLILFSNE